MTLAVAAGAAAGVGSLTRGEAADPPCAPPALQVEAAPEIAPVLDRLARTAGPAAVRCPDVAVSAQDPADVVAAMAAGAVGPDVWVPDSSLWLDRLLAAGRTAPADPPSVARSPVVFAVTPEVAGRLPAPRRVADLLAPGQPAGPATLGLPDPQRSARGVALLLGVSSALEGRADGRAARAAAVRSAQRDVSTDEAALLDQLEEPDRVDGGGALAVPVSEQSVWARNTSGDASRVVALYAPGGVVLDYPFVVLRGDAAAVEAARGLRQRLAGDDARRLLGEQGFRAPDGQPGPALTAEAGVDPTVAADTPPPAPEEVAAAVRAVSTLTLPSRLLAVFDVSGSMAQTVPNAGGRTRLDLARDAAKRGLALFADHNEIGLWEFSTQLTPNADHRELVPITPLGQTADGVPGRFRIGEALADVQVVPDGDTGLYDTVLAAVRAVRDTWAADRVNAVLLLTDGRNDDEDGLSLEQLLETLTAEADPARSVRVITIGYGPDSDTAALARISEATGGVGYVARDPHGIDGVFLDAIGQRP